jgi:hypothetical protein
MREEHKYPARSRNRHTCNVVDTFLSRLELVLAESTVTRKFGLRRNYACFLILFAISSWMDVPKMLMLVSGWKI